MGIEPTSSAWEAEVLPLNYTRIRLPYYPASNGLYKSFSNIFAGEPFGLLDVI
jgi:hypothetical protein